MHGYTSLYGVGFNVVKRIINYLLLFCNGVKIGVKGTVLLTPLIENSYTYYHNCQRLGTEGLKSISYTRNFAQSNEETC